MGGNNTIPLLGGGPILGKNVYAQEAAAGINPYWGMMDAANPNNLGVTWTMAGSELTWQNWSQVPEYLAIGRYPEFPPYLPGIPLPASAGFQTPYTYGWQGNGQPPLTQPLMNQQAVLDSMMLQLPAGFNIQPYFPANPGQFNIGLPQLIPTPDLSSANPFGAAPTP